LSNFIPPLGVLGVLSNLLKFKGTQPPDIENKSLREELQGFHRLLRIQRLGETPISWGT